MNYFISAGETSGDLHASHLMTALAERDPHAHFEFLGGDMMAACAGHEPLVHCRDMAYMGFSEVIRHLPDVGRNLRKAREAITERRPDVVILVDYPGFNLRLARIAAKAGIPVFYYIAPKVWAWKSWRVKAIRKLCRRVLSILPFEPGWFAARGVSADYVGNPSVTETDTLLKELPSRMQLISDHNLTNRPILALVPGSRLSEIRNNLPVMVVVARKRRELQAVVAGAPGVPEEFYRRFTTLPVIFDSTFTLMAHSTAALVTSGTASLECALAGTPQVVLYRANGSGITYGLMKRILKVRHVSLPNLIVGRTVVDEKLLHHCTPGEVNESLVRILPGKYGRDHQLEGYAEMRARLGGGVAAARAAEIIIDSYRSIK